MKRELGWSALTILSGIAVCAQTNPPPSRALVNQYCVGCHNDKLKSGGFSWTKVNLAHADKSRIGSMTEVGRDL